MSKAARPCSMPKTGPGWRLRFTRPNRYRFFGLVLEQGAFEVVRNAAGDPTIDPIAVALDDAVALEPNPYFRTIDEIRQHVAARRAAGP